MGTGLPEPFPQGPEDYYAWKKAVLRHRAQVYYETGLPGDAGEKARAREIVRVRRSFVYLANTYGAIFEARPDEDEWEATVDDDGVPIDLDDEWERGILVPYVMYPFQLEVARWLDERMSTRGPQGDGVMVKARDMGLSNEVGFWVAHSWLTRRRFQARLLSRKEDLVDRLGDPDSLFWKIEAFLMALPEWLLRAFVGDQFSWREHRTLMRLINPKTGNLVSGESTAVNAGRGGRASVVVMDEAAFMPGFGKIWSATRASTRHRLAISTVSVDEGLDFYNLEQGKTQEQPAVLRISYDQHPDHGPEWLAQERKRDTDEGIRREVLMDYFAGYGEFVYPETHDVETGIFPYEPYAGPLYCAIDDGFDDHWAMVFLQYHPRTGRVRVLDAYVNQHKPADFYATLLRGLPRSDFAAKNWYGEREQRLMRQIREWPPMTFVGDTHGEHVEQLAGMSVWAHFAKEWGIVVNVDYLHRQHRDRRHFTGMILPMTDFNDSEGAEYVLESFKRHRFKKVREGKDQVTEYKEPLHSDASHPVTAFEYFATQLDIFRTTRAAGGSVKWTGRRNGPGSKAA